MKIKMNRIQSRAVAFILLVALIVIVIIGFAWPTWWLHIRYDKIIEDSLDRLSRYRRIASIRPALEESLAEVERGDPRRYYWKGSTTALVAADIQGAVTKIVAANQGRISASQILPTQEDSKATEPQAISVSIQMTASIISLQLILHTIESHTPYLFIDHLFIQGHQGRGYKPVPGIQPEFAVQFTVRGYNLSRELKS